MIYPHSFKIFRASKVEKSGFRGSKARISAIYCYNRGLRTIGTMSATFNDPRSYLYITLYSKIITKFFNNCSLERLKFCFRASKSVANKVAIYCYGREQGFCGFAREFFGLERLKWFFRVLEGLKSKSLKNDADNRDKNGGCPHTQMHLNPYGIYKFAIGTMRTLYIRKASRLSATFFLFFSRTLAILFFCILILRDFCG